mgnify:CR=1 FL=1
MKYLIANWKMNSVDIDVWEQEFVNVVSSQNNFPKSDEVKLIVCLNLYDYTVFSEKIKNSKNEIFSKGIARFQINYLGYPGTMGTDAMDYLIADKIVIPENSKKYFTEKILYLPNCWLPSSKHREISKKNFQKKDFLIPKNKFVFCNFNNI